MKYLILIITSVLLVLHSVAHHVQARPEQQPHHPPMISQHEMMMEALPSNGTEAESSSLEATVDNMDSAEDDNITVQAKASPICPPRQSEIVDIEKECLMEDKLKDPECTSPAPMTDKDGMEMSNPTTENATPMAEETTIIPTTETSTTNATVKHGRRHRKRTCNYHLCILRRLDVLDSSDMPDKNMLMNWISNNVTDDKQQEKTQQKLGECVAALKDIFGESMESSKSTEDEAQDEIKNDETPMNRKKKSCTAAKKVISCLSKSTECPVLKF